MLIVMKDAEIFRVECRALVFVLGVLSFMLLSRE